MTKTAQLHFIFMFCINALFSFFMILVHLFCLLLSLQSSEALFDKTKVSGIVVKHNTKPTKCFFPNRLLLGKDKTPVKQLPVNPCCHATTQRQQVEEATW